MQIGAFEDECLVGRDILRFFTTMLDGPTSNLNAFRETGSRFVTGGL